MHPLLRSTLHGSFGFTLVSLAAYSIWAFAPRLGGSEIGMYILIALVFLSGSGLTMSGLLTGPSRLRRFYILFIPAFTGYAILWSLAWFVIKDRPGEWIGAISGILFFAAFAWFMLGRPRGFWLATIVLFALHTLGYFMGGQCMYGLLHSGISGWSKPHVAILAKLSWGLCHGIGFGAGIGFALGRWQQP